MCNALQSTTTSVGVRAAVLGGIVLDRLSPLLALAAKLPGSRMIPAAHALRAALALNL
jgi:hypothetical protein